MKKTFTIIALLLIITFQPSCSEPNKKTPKPNKLEQFDWLIGSWSNVSSEGELFERWIKTNDSTFSGNSFFISNNDTLFSEQISLELKGFDIFYTPTVSNQNQGKAVCFKLISDTNNVFVFENKLHDFPQRIIYTNPLPDSLYARIEGTEKGENRFEEFSFKRVKTK